MASLRVFPISTPGGINQSAPSPQPQDLEELENFAIFRGRVGLRPPFEVIATVQDDNGTPADVDEILDIVDHEGKLYTLSWSSTEQDVYLHSMDVDGQNLTLEAVVYTGQASAPGPTLSMTSFTGGTAGAGVSRLYISDYNQNLDTVFWDGSNITTLAWDLDSSGSAENIIFSMTIAFKFHLWGAGFFEAAIQRPEMLRYSQPGAIPATDTAGGTNPKEFFAADHRSVGRRGDKVVAWVVVGDRLVVFQKRATHAIFGSGTDTWTRQGLSDIVGCVGPKAVTAIDERVAYFWASDGPYRTNGTDVEYIGDDIRQIVTEVDASELKTQVGHSPDDGLVYFFVSEGGADDYSKALVFDTRRERWFKNFWLIGTSTKVEFGAVGFLDSAAAPGPAGAPSALVGTGASATSIDLVWVNGDVNVDNKTHVYRDTSTVTPSDATTRVAIVVSGATAYTDTGLTADTNYFYKLRHFRNATHSSETSEDQTRTFLALPTVVGLAGLTDGLTVSGTNNASGADIRIDRKVAAGSFAEVITLSNPGGSFSHPDTGLDCDTEYFYRTRAELAGSTNSAWTATISRDACDASVIPLAPTSPTTSSVLENSITVGWTDASNNEDSFEVHRSLTTGSGFTLIGNPLSNAVSFVSTFLTSNTQYFYKILARNNVGPSAFTSEVNATTLANLNKPTNIVAVLGSPSVSKIDLTWDDVSTDESGFEVHQSSTGSGGTYSLITTTEAGEESYSAVGLSADQEYHFKLRAVLAAQTGDFSDIVNATTLGNPPTAPTMTSAIKDSGSPSDKIDVIWVDNSSDEDGFELFMKVGAGEYPGTPETTTAAGVQTFKVESLANGILYTFKVRATNTANGASDFSAEASDTTDGTPVVPGDPTTFVATPNEADLDATEVSEIALTWAAGTPGNQDNFLIERCTGTGCSNFASLVTVGAGETSYNDTTVTDSHTTATIYKYRIFAQNVTGDSGDVDTGDITLEGQVTPILDSVTDLSDCDGPTAVAKAKIDLTSGFDTTGLVTRKVERTIFGQENWSAVFTGGAGLTTHTDDTIVFGVFYEYRVVDDHGSSGENTGTFTSGVISFLVEEEPFCG